MFAERYSFKRFYEVVEQNPYLAGFYKDMKRWAFHLQVFFLSKRFAHHYGIQRSGEATIQDRSIYEDPYVFAKNLYLQGNMSENDYRCYLELFENMAQNLEVPDLLVYLRASVPTLCHRIAQRGREFERSIKREYLQQLANHYEDWVATYPGKVLTIDTDGLDFVNNPEDFASMCEQVWESLEQTTFEVPEQTELRFGLRALS
ncbi:MAG: hypothetical protein A2284_17200 [Deltaproteobacteria bacterium RIFOXYA12_FULL_61_11]|nr:MAG: hypothetical protein A2284_17200 [Deltaproteobacteria bacterium RIFOXYA12_FULL_61_11]